MMRVVSWGALNSSLFILQEEKRGLWSERGSGRGAEGGQNKPSFFCSVSAFPCLSVSLLETDLDMGEGLYDIDMLTVELMVRMCLISSW